jgi:hypothetical protein
MFLLISIKNNNYLNNVIISFVQNSMIKLNMHLTHFSKKCHLSRLRATPSIVARTERIASGTRAVYNACSFTFDGWWLVFRYVHERPSETWTKRWWRCLISRATSGKTLIARSSLTLKRSFKIVVSLRVKKSLYRSNQSNRQYRKNNSFPFVWKPTRVVVACHVIHVLSKC